MNERLKSLVEQGKLAEADCYYPHGRYVDGSPYSYSFQYRNFISEAIHLLGGPKNLEQLILERKKNEPLADPDCGNWMMWTILNEIDVSRERI